MPPGNPINQQTAVWIKEAMQAIGALPPEQQQEANSALTLVSKYPVLGTIILLIGLIRLVGLPIHTLIDNYLVKKLPPAEYAKIKTDGSTLFKQFDWLVNLFLSVKPSNIAALTSQKSNGSTEAQVAALVEQKVAGILKDWQAAQSKNPAAVPPGPANSALDIQLAATSLPRPGP
jgi:hypothetical protein